MITNAVSLDPARAEVTVHPVSIIATDRVLICLVESSQAFQPAQLLLSKESMLARGSVEAALQLVIGAVINTYESVVSWLESSTDDLANIMFQERPLDKPEQLHAFKLRTALSQVRRLTDPMRAVMNDLSTHRRRRSRARPPAAMRPAAAGRCSPSSIIESPMPPTRCARPCRRCSTPALPWPTCG